MKFDVIIGNPPYNDGPEITIYNYFVNRSFELNPNHAIFIIPARWFVGGKGLNDFRKLMMYEYGNKIKTLIYEKISKSIFPSVNIAGGICYFHYDKNHKGLTKFITYKNNQKINSFDKDLIKDYQKYNFLITHGQSIIEKIEKYNDLDFFNKKVLTRNSFDVSSNFDDIVLTEDAFKVRSFFENIINNKSKNYNVKIYHVKNNKRLIGYIQEKDYCDKFEIKNKFKLLLSKAHGANDNFRIKSFIAKPGEICSETYLVLYYSSDEKIVKNVQSYLDTKFFHYLLRILKITQNNSRVTFRMIPNLDFSKSWTDQELYEKFKLSKKEIDDIEGNELVKENNFFNNNIFTTKYFKIKTNFKNISDVQTNEYNVKIYYNKKNVRHVGYVRKNIIKDKFDIKNKYKLLLPKASNSFSKDNNLKINHKPIIAKPGEICSDTYIVIYVSDSLKEIENVQSYLNTKFFVYLLFILKKTQDSPKKVYELIPNLDFSRSWNDKDLYEKFKLSKEEIDEIERSVDE